MKARIWLRDGTVAEASGFSGWAIMLDNGKQVLFERDVIAVQNPAVVVQRKMVTPSQEALTPEEHIRRVADALDREQQARLYRHLYALGHRISG